MNNFTKNFRLLLNSISLEITEIALLIQLGLYSQYPKSNQYYLLLRRNCHPAAYALF